MQSWHEHRVTLKFVSWTLQFFVSTVKTLQSSKLVNLLKNFITEAKLLLKFFTIFVELQLQTFIIHDKGFAVPSMLVFHSISHHNSFHPMMNSTTTWSVLFIFVRLASRIYIEFLNKLRVMRVTGNSASVENWCCLHLRHLEKRYYHSTKCLTWVFSCHTHPHNSLHPGLFWLLVSTRKNALNYA